MAHNAPFDLRFLNYERRRLWGRYFTQPWLDTLVLARRLLNGQVARHDLGSLVGLGRHRRAPLPPRPARRRGHGRGARPADRHARGSRRRHARAGRPLRGSRRRPPRVQAGAGGGPADLPGRLRDARPRRQGALCGQGGQPAPPGALVLRPRRPPRPPHRPGARAARVDRARDLRFRVRRAAARGRADQEPAPTRATGAERPGPATTSSSPPPRASPRLYAVPRVRDDGAAYFGPLRSAAPDARGGRVPARALPDLRRRPRRGGRGPSPSSTRCCAATPTPSGSSACGSAVAWPAGPSRSTTATESGRPEPCSGPWRPWRARAARPRPTAVLVERAEREGAAEVFFVGGGVVRHSTTVDLDTGNGRGRLSRDSRCSRASRRAPWRPTRLSRRASWRSGCATCASTGAALELASGWDARDALRRVGGAVRALADVAAPVADPELADG